MTDFAMRDVGLVALAKRLSTGFRHHLLMPSHGIQLRKRRIDSLLWARHGGAPAAASAAAAATAAGPTAPELTAQPSASVATTAATHIQSVDFTTLAACVAELQRNWLPAKVEQAVQVETSMLALRLRTLRGNAWLYLSWHATTAHLGLSEQAPERGAVSEAFQFGEQVNSLTRGLVLSDVCQPHSWERVVQLSLAPRPTEPPVINLMCEVQGRYSNVVVTDGDNKVLTAGHQVGSKSVLLLLDVRHSVILYSPMSCCGSDLMAEP